MYNKALQPGFIPPYACAEPFAGHAPLDLVRRLCGCIFCLRGPRRRLVMPFLVDDLEAHHFVVIVKQPVLVKVPDPKLLAVVTAEQVSISCYASGGVVALTIRHPGAALRTGQICRRKSPSSG